MWKFTTTTMTSLTRGGSAQVMLLQHGFSRSGRFWYNWVPMLGREFRILRPDMRGMGHSTMLEARYEPSLDTFATDIRYLLDHLGDRPSRVRG